MRHSAAAVLLTLCGMLYACARHEDPMDAWRAGDETAAFAGFLAAAEAGDVAAQTAVGTFYYLGVGTSRDYAQALAWYEKAALAGDAHARRNLGSMFRHGHGTPQDDFRAFGWYDAARSAGHSSVTEYLRLTALSVGWNQQALARRIVEEDLKNQVVSHGSHRKATR
jgi:TPR repeat protein